MPASNFSDFTRNYSCYRVLVRSRIGQDAARIGDTVEIHAVELPPVGLHRASGNNVQHRSADRIDRPPHGARGYRRRTRHSCHRGKFQISIA